MSETTAEPTEPTTPEPDEPTPEPDGDEK